MRKQILPLFIVFGALVLIIRLFYLQIIDTTYKLKSDNNAIKKEYNFPERGYIYDRNGKLLVANQSSYDIMVIPRDIKEIDTLEFCELLNIDIEYFIKKIEKAEKYSPRLPSVFISQLNKKEYAAFQEKERKYSGFYTQKRALRDYQVNIGANIFGYIKQVNQTTINGNSYYNNGDLIGVQGVEQFYENELRGVKGVRYFLRDKFNSIIGSFGEGKYDTIAQRGKDLTLTIDYELQKYGTELMINKRGGIVAIEPSSGEILALVTAPTYDPGLLVGRQRSPNYTKLHYDSINKPLFDRSLKAKYPPGSPFKIITGLVALDEGVIDEETGFACRHGFYYGKRAFMKCHDSGTSVLNNGIYNSCNTYFCQIFRKSIQKYTTAEEGIDIWSRKVRSFGLGDFLGTDLPIGTSGRVPDSNLYKRLYKKGQLRSTYIISNAIGQGEVETSPIQLANMMAAVANQGFFYTPHIVKNIKGQKLDKKFTTKHVVEVNKKYFSPVIQGLADVYNKGTARSLKVNDLEICGKTGTAENKIRVGNRVIQLKDHSIFVAFAPKDNPKIAIAVFVENGGFGNTYAGPIATIMIEKYLKNEVSRKDLEKRMLTNSLEPVYRNIENIIYSREPKKPEPSQTNSTDIIAINSEVKPEITATNE